MLEPRGGEGLEPRRLDELLPPLVPVQQDGRRLQVKLTHHYLPTTHQRLHNRTRLLEASSVADPDMDRKYGLLIRMQADKRNYAKNNEKNLCFSKLMCSHGGLEAFPLF